MTMYFTIAVIILVFVVIFQIAKASEYVSVLKGEEQSRKQNNKINGFLMITFLILGLVGVWYCNELYYPKTLFAQPSASDHGERIDRLMMITITITGIVFFITQIALFWFAYKYQEKENKKAFYYPHNNKLEIIWTVIPAVTLAILVVMGLRDWFVITGKEPANAMTVEITGKQFGWFFRYPGKDNVLGKKYYRNIDEKGGNDLGQIWDDQANFDDIVVTQTMYAVKDKPLKLVIYSRDVIHDVGLPHFRLKADAVPGIPTSLWFTPKYTTKEMKEITGNPDFVYEIACDQMCGNGHYSMKGIIEVVTQQEYDAWIKTQKPKYEMLFSNKGTTTETADSTQSTASINKIIKNN